MSVTFERDRTGELVGGPRPATGRPATATVEIVIPVHDEERALPGCVRTLHAYLRRTLRTPWSITVVDNASTDATPAVAAELARTHPGVSVLRLDRKGRGLALREAWSRSRADVVAYMDVDLSTGLDALFPLLAPLLTGHSELAIGSRLAPGARVVRGWRREMISRGYNGLIRVSHRARFSDAQCGFKAARTDVLRALLPAVRDDSWFFDTELLLLAEHNGLRIHEVPVDWVEDVDSRVDVAATARDDLRGLLRVARAKADGSALLTGLPRRPAVTPTHPDAVLARRTPGPGGAAPRTSAPVTPGAARSVGATGGSGAGDGGRCDTRWQLLCFVLIGLVSTAATIGLYALLRNALPPVAANLVALVTTAVVNTEANRRLTFAGFGSRSGRPTGAASSSGRGMPGRVHLRGVVVFGLYWAFTSGALVALTALVPDAGRGAEVAVLIATTAIGTAARFALLRYWVFGPRRSPARPVVPGPTTP